MRLMQILLFLLTLAIPALASDGVLEINQTCAVQTGCFSGDTPGFPVTIGGTAGSSYLLTGDLSVADVHTNGIFIDASYVTFDLGGHRVIGPVLCSGTPIVCAPSGSGRGVSTGGVNGVRIRNGTVTGFGDFGVITNVNGSIEDVIAVSNGGIGLYAGQFSIVDRCQADGNGGNGINGLTGVRVSNSSAVLNGGIGIEVGDAADVSDNTASNNEGHGISAGPGSTVSGNTASNNEDDGIDANIGSTVSGNTTYLNGGNGIRGTSGMTISGNSSYENTGDGISANNGCTIRGNTVRGNDGWGLEILSITTSYRENTISTSGGTFLGTVDGGTNAGGNVCNGSLTCP